MLTNTPKDLLVTCRETNLCESPEILFNQASNVNGTRPETHARAEFSIFLPVLPSHGTQVTETFLAHSTANTVFSMNSEVIRRETQRQTKESPNSHSESKGS